jgi:hypothetical protein
MEMHRHVSIRRKHRLYLRRRSTSRKVAGSIPDEVTVLQLTYSPLTVNPLSRKCRSLDGSRPYWPRRLVTGTHLLLCQFLDPDVVVSAVKIADNGAPFREAATFGEDWGSSLSEWLRGSEAPCNTQGAAFLEFVPAIEVGRWTKSRNAAI